MKNEKKYLIETHEGERLIGLLAEPTGAFYEAMGIPPMMMVGYWLLRENKRFSFVGRHTVKVIRPALKIDKEICRKI